jgi:hypothetical protein
VQIFGEEMCSAHFPMRATESGRGSELVARVMTHVMHVGGCYRIRATAAA